ncbi:pyrroline-5-carboxylate reductase family protein, partial [Coleofasciculus chthonoplastes]|uniref:pyrroline-5-carboxylate reductase family protein n=1 Tax=Coleofasciculus chthonoplastes TaxID=64178 RepID=UPI0018DBACBA
MSIKLGIIGGGVMGEAILSRLIAQQVYRPDQVLVSDPQAQRREDLSQRYGVNVTSDNGVAAEAGEVLLLAIKPQVFKVVASGLVSNDDNHSPASENLPVVISILAGVSLTELEAVFEHQPVIRAMPNTPA